MVVLSCEEAESQIAAHEAAIREVGRQLDRRARGDEGEAHVRRLLAALEPEGWVALHARHWPGTRRADLDHVLIGPGGVVVLDSKTWRGPVLLRDGRLLQGQADVTHEIDDVAAQTSAVQEVLAPLLLSPVQVIGALVFVGQRMPLSVAGAVHVLDELTLLRWLRALGRKFTASQVAAVAAVVEQAVPAHQAPRRPAVAVVRPQIRRREARQDALFDLDALDLVELERAVALGMEEWMTYLHPSQLDVVRRQANGPSRVRGPAGCGKTVVALHRAAHLLSREPGELLFLSYVRTLPLVFSRLYERLSPHTAGRAHFAGLHSHALHLLRECGVSVQLDQTAADTCLARAWASVGRPVLGSSSLPRDYWEDEVRHVIKGRGLTQFADYAELARTGRRTRLTAEQRSAVWDMSARYQELLVERNVHDFDDVISMALAAARSGQAPLMRFVVVDEAQDLTLQAVRLAAALVSEDREGLTLVGDGQQAVYPGGYTLKEAGITVAGRSSVLTVNYRNTREVLAAAQLVVSADDFDDLEGLGEPGDRQTQAVREGTAVCDVVARDALSADVALLRQLRADGRLGHAGSAVLCRTRGEAAHVCALLRKDGLPVLGLEDYDGVHVEAIKVGTVKRAKGLEFVRVYLPRVDLYVVEQDAAEVERVQRERRELFVAMTRARDGLWRCRVGAA